MTRRYFRRIRSALFSIRLAIHYLPVCLFLLFPVQNAWAEADSIPYPNPLNLLEDQWTSKNSEGVEIQLYQMDSSLFSDGETLPITLYKAIQLTFENNLDLRAERYTPSMAAQEIKKAKGAFDTCLFSDFSHGYTRAGISSAIQSAGQTVLETTISNADLGFRKLIQTGSLLEIKLDINRFKGNSSWLILNPSYTTRLNFTLAQPLLRNGGIAFNTGPIRIARNVHMMTEDRFQAFVTDMLLAVVQAYWDLSFAFQNLQVRETSLHLAEEILRTSEIQVKLGSLAPVDLLQSQTGVALRKEELVSSKNLLLTAEDVLKQLLQLPDAPLYSAVHVLPTDVPPPVPEHEEFSLEEVLRLSLKNRPELRAAHRDFETKNLQIKLAENQLLPKLDFAGGIGANGLGGSPKETDDFSALAALDPLQLFLVLIGAREPPKTTSPWGGGWQRSFYDMFHGESTYQWNVGMRFEIPLENNSAEASYRKAKMDAYKSLWTLRSMEQRILLEVRDAWRSLEMNRQKIHTSEATRVLAEKQLDAERKRMSLGLTTNYQVLQMEQDFRNAQTKSLVALAEYWKARAKMLKAAGTLLEKEGFSPKEVLSQGSS